MCIGFYNAEKTYQITVVAAAMSTVIVTTDTTVVTAIADARTLVSMPFFSAWIIGRFPTGTHPGFHFNSSSFLYEAVFKQKKRVKKA